MLCAIAQLRETQVGWCGGGIYSAVLILTVPEQSEETPVGNVGVFHFASAFLHIVLMVVLSRTFRFWGCSTVVGVYHTTPRTFTR